jgi:hypothetical protein
MRKGGYLQARATTKVHGPWQATWALAKIPGRRRHRVTLLGRRLLAAPLHYRQRDFPDAVAA